MSGEPLDAREANVLGERTGKAAQSEIDHIGFQQAESITKEQHPPGRIYQNIKDTPATSSVCSERESISSIDRKIDRIVQLLADLVSKLTADAESCDRTE